MNRAASLVRLGLGAFSARPGRCLMKYLAYLACMVRGHDWRLSRGVAGHVTCKACGARRPDYAADVSGAEVVRLWVSRIAIPAVANAPHSAAVWLEREASRTSIVLRTALDWLNKGAVPAANALARRTATRLRRAAIAARGRIAGLNPWSAASGRSARRRR